MTDFTTQTNALIASNTELKQTFEGLRDEIRNEKDAAIAELNTEKAGIAADAVATAASRVNVEADETAVAASKTNVDNDAAAIATAIADINNAIVPKLPLVNMHRDGGRFVDGSDGEDVLSVSSPFTTSLTEVVPYNGASITEAAKYHYDNSTEGGAGEALDQTVQDLLAAQSRAYSERRWGTEFYIAEIAAGSGIAASSIDSHYLMLASIGRALGLTNFISYAAWVRLTAGTAWIKKGDDLIVDGVAQGGNYELQAVNGWVHVAGTFTTESGYNSRYFPSLYGVDGTVIELAMPLVVPAQLTIAPHTHPLLAL